MVRAKKNWVTLALASVLATAVRCEQTSSNTTTQWKPLAKDTAPRVEDPGTESNIIRVSKFFNADPWLSFAADGSGRVDGVRITVYLEGPNAPKGVFGDGTLIVEMYRLDHEKRGREVPTLVHKWELPPDQAYPWRAKQATGMGWGYGLRLQWPAELDIQGKQVAFVVKYRRTDGRIVSSSRQVVNVPGAGVGP
ncbi:MAG TPA: hypothetical protein VMV94_12395 [Phycisphaerae bacterium]|nr:hypothetical protein [Phycisphaerae bacterium]